MEWDQSGIQMNSYKRADYALIRLPLMKDGTVYPEACIVVLVEKVNMVGIVQKYYLPQEPFSVRPHHLATMLPVIDQQKADQWFRSGARFLPSMSEARSLGLVDSSLSSGAASSSGSS